MATVESPVVDVVFVDGRVGQGEEEDEEDGEAKREDADQKITLFWLLIDQLDLLDKLTAFKHVSKLGLYNLKTVINVCKMKTLSAYQ